MSSVLDASLFSSVPSLSFVYPLVGTVSFAGSYSSMHTLNAGFLTALSLACSVFPLSSPYVTSLTLRVSTVLYF